MSKPNENKTRPINRLILVGNGFDLAHGMKTSYSDFILWYFSKCWEDAKRTHTMNYEFPNENIFSNELLTFTYDRNSVHYTNPFDKLELKDFSDIKALINPTPNSSSRKLVNLTFNSDFFKSVVGDFCNKNWVDIENLYYEFLKKRLNDHYLHIDHKISNLQPVLKKLNDHFHILKSELEEYLNSLLTSSNNQTTEDYIYEKPIAHVFERDCHFQLGDVMMLNFNYTATTEMYKGPDSDVIHIHGELNKKENPIIFGYGDERDETYVLLEKANIPEVFTHIKSFDYFKTDNYSRLLAFLESEFDVYIMGHSCGLSDRTLLSTIFEHENCRFIKIFYHNNQENYRKTTYEISRHFKDKAEMRKKVLDITKCNPLPQSKSV